MDKYEKWFEVLAERLKKGERFGLRMNLEGEGKFKDFQGEHEVSELKKFLDNACKKQVEEIIVRGENAEESIVSEF